MSILKVFSHGGHKKKKRLTETNGAKLISMSRRLGLLSSKPLAVYILVMAFEHKGIVLHTQHGKDPITAVGLTKSVS